MYKQVKPFGVDCTCPMTMKANTLDMVGVLFDLPDLSTTAASFLASGDFHVKAEAGDEKGPLGCAVLKFTVKSSKPKPGK